MKTTYILTDTFNNYIISRHKTIKNAVLAKRKHSRAVVRNNGQNSYIPKSIIASDGSDIREEVMETEYEIDCEY